MFLNGESNSGGVLRVVTVLATRNSSSSNHFIESSWVNEVLLLLASTNGIYLKVSFDINTLIIDGNRALEGPN